MANRQILFTGGGSTGHVIVNLALISVFQQEGWKIDYIGSVDGIERELIEQLDEVTYHPISTGKLRRYMSLENIKDPFKVLKGTVQAWNIIRKCRQSVLFSKGGFVSVPVVFAAKLRRIPTIIHESDYTPGLANKLAIPFAKRVLTTFPETVHYLPEKKARYVGAVIRDDLFQGSQEAGYTYTRLNKNKPILLVMGGSGGSELINSTVRKSLPELLSKFQIIHICGPGKRDSNVKGHGYVQYEYVSDQLSDLFAITDYVVSRAGANAIFEFLALRIPMLLIPLSLEASRGDQIVNAQSFEKSGYARVLEEESITIESFIEEVAALKKYGSMLVDRMKEYKSEEARDHVIQIINECKK